MGLVGEVRCLVCFSFTLFGGSFFLLFVQIVLFAWGNEWGVGWNIECKILDEFYFLAS